MHLQCCRALQGVWRVAHKHTDTPPTCADGGSCSANGGSSSGGGGRPALGGGSPAGAGGGGTWQGTLSDLADGHRHQPLPVLLCRKLLAAGTGLPDGLGHLQGWCGGAVEQGMSALTKNDVRWKAVGAGSVCSKHGSGSAPETVPIAQPRLMPRLMRWRRHPLRQSCGSAMARGLRAKAHPCDSLLAGLHGLSRRLLDSLSCRQAGRQADGWAGRQAGRVRKMMQAGGASRCSELCTTRARTVRPKP
jgi:hypothetical protein